MKFLVLSVFCEYKYLTIQRILDIFQLYQMFLIIWSFAVSIFQWNVKVKIVCYILNACGFFYSYLKM